MVSVLIFRTGEMGLTALKDVHNGQYQMGFQKVSSDGTKADMPWYAFWIFRNCLEAISFADSSRCLSG